MTSCGAAVWEVLLSVPLFPPFAGFRLVMVHVPPFAVVAGNPARPVRYRFRKETADRIIESQWWNKSIEELAGAPSEFATFLKPEE